MKISAKSIEQNLNQYFERDSIYAVDEEDSNVKIVFKFDENFIVTKVFKNPETGLNAEEIIRKHYSYIRLFFGIVFNTYQYHKAWQAKTHKVMEITLSKDYECYYEALVEVLALLGLGVEIYPKEYAYFMIIKGDKRATGVTEGYLTYDKKENQN